MSELDHILDVHLREARRAEAAMTLLAAVLIALGYGVYRMIGLVV